MPHNSAAKKGFDTESYKRVNTADYWHTKNEEKSVSEESGADERAKPPSTCEKWNYLTEICSLGCTLKQCFHATPAVMSGSAHMYNYTPTALIQSGSKSASYQ